MIPLSRAKVVESGFNIGNLPDNLRIIKEYPSSETYDHSLGGYVRPLVVKVEFRSDVVKPQWRDRDMPNEELMRTWRPLLTLQVNQETKQIISADHNSEASDLLGITIGLKDNYRASWLNIWDGLMYLARLSQIELPGLPYRTDDVKHVKKYNKAAKRIYARTRGNLRYSIYTWKLYSQLVFGISRFTDHISNSNRETFHGTIEYTKNEFIENLREVIRREPSDSYRAEISTSLQNLFPSVLGHNFKIFWDCWTDTWLPARLIRADGYLHTEELEHSSLVLNGSRTSFYTGLARYTIPNMNYTQANNTVTRLNYTRGSSGWYDSTIYTEDTLEGIIPLSSLVEVTCTECGTVGMSNRLSIIEGVGCSVCIDSNLGRIHPYSTRVPSLIKFKAKNMDLKQVKYFGIEIEVSTTSEMLKNRDAILVGKSLANHAILKSDGSIRGYGFEIVSCPATIDIHKEEYKQYFKLRDENKIRSKGNSTTGMHVHLSRSVLSSLTIGKISKFLNSEENLTYIRKIAGRDRSNYAEMDPSRTITSHCLDNGQRYNVLNLQPPSTIEFRMFSTPDTYEDFVTKLEFVDAVSTYCSPCATDLKLNALVKATNFIDWVKRNKRSYPNLAKKNATISTS